MAYKHNKYQILSSLEEYVSQNVFYCKYKSINTQQTSVCYTKYENTQV